ncbi:MAG: hypothetical protein M9921_01470 [Fimbriimonadaceae bacterium]|nr:hypothetical protein [Fimbriimonadaceae bacterium]
MILATLAWTAMQAPRIVETIMPADGLVCVQAIAPVPEQGPRDLAAAKVLARVLPLATQDFTPGQMLAYALQGGDRMRCILTPDSIRVTITLPKGQMAIAAALLESVLRRPSLEEADVQRALEELPFQHDEPWWQALASGTPDAGRVRTGTVRELAKRLFRPDTVVLSAAGAFEPGEARAALESRFAGWQAVALPRPLPDAPPVEAWREYHGRVHVLAWAGKPFSGRDVALPQRLLALCGLGVGKGSVLHEVVRESLALSYRQEAMLRPDPDGFAPRLMFAHRGTWSAEMFDTVQTTVLKAVQEWTEEDRERALGIARAELMGDVPLGLLALDAHGPPPYDLRGRAFLAGYWLMKTGSPYDPSGLLQSMGSVRLQEMKDAAREIVETSRREWFKAD